jgi:hypothetical protein
MPDARCSDSEVPSCKSCTILEQSRHLRNSQAQGSITKILPSKPIDAKETHAPGHKVRYRVAFILQILFDLPNTMIASDTYKIKSFSLRIQGPNRQALIPSRKYEHTQLKDSQLSFRQWSIGVCIMHHVSLGGNISIMRISRWPSSIHMHDTVIILFPDTGTSFVIDPRQDRRLRASNLSSLEYWLSDMSRSHF